MPIAPATSETFGNHFGGSENERHKTGKSVTFLWVTITPQAWVSGVENPCVGGSIPPQATRNGEKARPS
jgi:hypothetical protein